MGDILAEYWLSFLIVFVIAFGLAFVLTPLTIYLGKRWKVVDKPGGRRKHDEPTSRLGGLAMVVAFIAAIIFAQFLPVERTDDQEIIRLTGLILGAVFIYGVGLADDLYELSPLPQYVAQVIAGAIAVTFLIFIESFNNPFTGATETGWPFWVTVTISLFWFGFMMNTVNWLDGLDGLAAGVVGIAALMIFIHATFQLEQVSVGLLALALVGATFGFLPFNFSPAKVFMGNGAAFLGYSLGVLSIIGGAKMATVLLVMGLPLIDAAWQIFRRLMQGRNPIYGDRGHLHFRLVDMGYSPRLIVMGYYIFCSLFGAVALITASRLFKLIALVIMGLLLAGTFIFISYHQSHTASRNSLSDESSSS